MRTFSNLLPIDVGERVLNFRLRFLELSSFQAEWKARYGEVIPIKDLIGRMNDMSIDEMVLLLWCGMKSEAPDLTEKFLFENLDFGHLLEIQDRLGEFVIDALPEAKKKTARLMQKKMMDQLDAMAAQVEKQMGKVGRTVDALQSIGKTSSPQPTDAELAPMSSGG